MLSGTLEFSLLKRLVNCHAAGVFDKSSEDDLEHMMKLIEQYLIRTPQATNSNSVSSLTNTLRGIRDLMSEWNKRLAFEEKRIS